MCLPTLWITIRTNLLNTDSLCCVCFMHPWVFFFFGHCSLWLVAELSFLLSEFLCQALYVNGKPSGSRESFKKAFVEEWVFISGDSSDRQNVMDFPVLHSTDHSDCTLETPRISKQFDSLPWEPTRPQDKGYCWERIVAPLPPLRPRLKCNFTHSR